MSLPKIKINSQFAGANDWGYTGMKVILYTSIAGTYRCGLRSAAGMIASGDAAGLKAYAELRGWELTDERSFREEDRR